MNKLIAPDPGGEKLTGAIAVASRIAHRHVQCYTRLPNTSAPFEDRFELQAGLWQFYINNSILPIALRIGQNISDDWYATANFETVRGVFQEPIVRLINPGDEIVWRPVFPGLLPPSLNLVLLARTNTKGG